MTKYKGYYYSMIPEGGYRLYNSEQIKIIDQPSPYNRLFVPEGTDEDNAKAHIDGIVTPSPEPDPTPEEQLRADVDFIAIMKDLTLPSQEVEEEGE